jgi:hypothetical protein
MQQENEREHDDVGWDEAIVRRTTQTSASEMRTFEKAPVSYLRTSNLNRSSHHVPTETERPSVIESRKELCGGTRGAPLFRSQI